MPKETKKPTSFSLSESDMERLTAISTEIGETNTNVVRKALRLYEEALNAQKEGKSIKLGNKEVFLL